MRVINLIFETGKEFVADDCPRLAAALAYYTIFSLPPLLLIIISIASAVFELTAVHAEVKQQLASLFGPGSAIQIEEILRPASDPTASQVGGFVGAMLLLIGATAVLVELQGALNRVWNVEPDPRQGGLRNFVFKRFISFTMLLGIAFLLMVSLVVNVTLAAIGQRIALFLPGAHETFLRLGNFTVSFAVTILLFAVMYKFLPDAKIAWCDVWLGATVTSLLFVIGNYCLGLYLGTRDFGSAYGAAGSLVAILLWIYYAAMIFYFGAEFTQAWTKQCGRQARPEAGAARLVSKKYYTEAVSHENQ